jgi:16S rRNA (uracil1498-N3)-methyltransferase
VHARFHVPTTLVSGQTVALPADEAAHASRVLRLHAGDQVRVFDGGGHEFTATVVQMTRTQVAVMIGEPFPAAPERRMAVTLAPAVIKGDKMDDVVRDAVMMGVTAIVPLVTDRSEVSHHMLERGHRRERWERIAVVSAKQCGRAVVPRIDAACDLQPLCERLASDANVARLMFVEPSAVPGGSANRIPARPSSAVVLIGPEGGWSSEELANTARLVSHVTLRGPTLRADAMPIIALTALFTAWGEL